VGRTLLPEALGRLGRPAGRLGCAAAPEWLSGNRIAPAKLNDRCGPPDIAMVATATALIVVAATDSQKVGGRTAGMRE